MLPRWLVAGDVEAGRLAPVLAAYEVEPIPVFAVYRTQSRGTAVVRSFVERMRRSFDAPPTAAPS